MTNKKFKEIKTNIKSFEKVINFVSGNLVAIIINGVTYSKSKKEGALTIKQLEEFTFLSDFESKDGISL